jgi:O-acetyl-ADP-ribose deacetylase (regulator of RNase III)
VQGCNCFETMGSGIAREIKARYPAAYTADVHYSRSGDYNKLGNFSSAVCGSFTIINAYTQYDFSRGKDVFEYNSFAMILQKLAHQYPNAKFGFPLIGCGLAGGDKDRIMAMLTDFADDVYVTDGKVSVVEFAP